MTLLVSLLLLWPLYNHSSTRSSKYSDVIPIILKIQTPYHLSSSSYQTHSTGPSFSLLTMLQISKSFNTSNSSDQQFPALGPWHSYSTRMRSSFWLSAPPLPVISGRASLTSLPKDSPSCFLSWPCICFHRITTFKKKNYYSHVCSMRTRPVSHPILNLFQGLLYTRCSVNTEIYLPKKVGWVQEI